MTAGCGDAAVRAFQQAPPAFEEERAIVQLDREQRALVEVGPREQVVADLSRAGAESMSRQSPSVIRAIADDARVRGPEAAGERAGDDG
jgi:hypothetical protein